MKMIARKSLRQSAFTAVLCLSVLTPTFAHASTDPEPPPPTATSSSTSTTSSTGSAWMIALSALGLF